MYELAGDLEDVNVAPGSNLLVLGQAMTGKQRLTHEILARGAIGGDGTIIVSTSDGAGHVIRAFEQAIGEVNEEPVVGVIDCVSGEQVDDDLEGSYQIRYASSPVDMTGIGINLSELLETFHEEKRLERNRVMLDNISTMLMYSNLQTIFRFLHVFTGRVQNADGLGLYLLDPSAHDAQTLNTLKGLFDGMIEIEDDEVTFTGVEV